MRRFMKPTKVSLLLAVVLAGALVLAGCGNGGNDPVNVFTWHGHYDVVVIGSGVSGYTAYLTIMDEAPHLNVLFIEQMSVSGGITRTAGGPSGNAWLFNYRDMTDEQIIAAWTNRMTGAGNDTTPLTNTSIGFIADNTAINPATGLRWYPDFSIFIPVVRAAREAFFFLNNQFDNPAVFNPALTGGAANPPGLGGAGGTVNAFTGMGGSGVAYMRAFELAGNRVGGYNHLKLNARATRLHMDGDRAVGITYRHNGSDRNVTGRQIVFATGNFAENLDMKIRFSQATDRQPATGLRYFFMQVLHDVGADGSGIQILERDAFADLHMSGFGVISGARPHRNLQYVDNAILTQPSTHLESVLLGAPFHVFVNGEGQRTRAEHGNDLWTAATSHHMLVENLFPYWMVFSSCTGASGTAGNAQRAAIQEAIAFGAGNSPQAALVRREVVTATSIPLLAAAMFPDDTEAQENFVATIIAYEAMFDGPGTDATFTDILPAAKTSAQAGGVRFGADAGPFYAVRLYPTGWDTAGGVKTNVYGQVLSGGNAITNLFAVGGVSNRVFYGQTYHGGTSLTLYPGKARIVGFRLLEQLRADHPELFPDE